MLEVLQFVFSGFWIWLGTVVIVLAVGNTAIVILAVLIGKK